MSSVYPVAQNRATIQRMEIVKSKFMSPVPKGDQILEILEGGYGVGRCAHNPNHNGPLLQLYRNQKPQGYVSFQIEDRTQTVILHTGGGAGADATGILMKHALRILRREYSRYSLEMTPAPGAATAKTVALLAGILKRIVEHEGVTGSKIEKAKKLLTLTDKLRKERKEQGYEPKPDLNAWDERVMLETTGQLRAIALLGSGLNFQMGILLNHGKVLGNMYGQHTPDFGSATPKDWYLSKTESPGTVAIKIDPGSVEWMYEAIDPEGAQQLREERFRAWRRHQFELQIKNEEALEKAKEILKNLPSVQEILSTLPSVDDSI